MLQLNFVQQGQGPLVVLSHPVGCDLTKWNDMAMSPRSCMNSIPPNGAGLPREALREAA